MKCATCRGSGMTGSMDRATSVGAPADCFKCAGNGNLPPTTLTAHFLAWCEELGVNVALTRHMNACSISDIPNGAARLLLCADRTDPERYVVEHKDQGVLVYPFGANASTPTELEFRIQQRTNKEINEHLKRTAERNEQWKS